jgi:hypothetical protein
MIAPSAPACAATTRPDIVRRSQSDIEQMETPMSAMAVISALIIFPAAAFGWVAIVLAAREAWKAWKQRERARRA